MKDGRDVLELLLRERSPEERERLAEAWERAAGGDPDSLPAIYALADRFSLEAHAALLAEIRTIHAHLEGMAREIGQGARATVERTEAASKATANHAGHFAENLSRLESLVLGQEQRGSRAIAGVEAAAGKIERSLGDAKRRHDKASAWEHFAFLALLTALVSVAGFLLGGKFYEMREVERLKGLIHRWDGGDEGAGRAIGEEIKLYRQKHGEER